MALPNKTLERIIPDALTIMHWFYTESMKTTEVMFIKALFDTIKTCQIKPMDTLFKPLIETGIEIPESVVNAIATFTQSVVEYEPKQRKLSI